MDAKEFKKFMDAQVKEAQKFKDEQEKKCGKDLGDAPIYQWIYNRSETFREKWEKQLKSKDGING